MRLATLAELLHRRQVFTRVQIALCSAGLLLACHGSINGGVARSPAESPGDAGDGENGEGSEPNETTDDGSEPSGDSDASVGRPSERLDGSSAVEAGAANRGLSISPSSLGTTTGASTRFTVESGVSVEWSLDEAKGCGSIKSDGTYTAPDVAATCNLTATSTANRQEKAHAVVVVFANTVGTWVNITPPPVWKTLQDPVNNVCTLGVGLSLAAPLTVYVGTGCAQKLGVWKTTDGGNSWAKANTGVYFNNDGSRYTGGQVLDNANQWTISVDPTDPDVLYAPAGFGSAGQGLWKSTNGGTDWRQLMPNGLSSATSADIYALTINPLNHLHLLVTFHSGWNFGANAGVIESTDGGATWIQHPPMGNWGAGHYVFFLGQDDAGKANSDYWLLATQSGGFWRTTNAGKTWTQVSSQYNMQHGAGALYRAKNGVLYSGAVSHLIRSTDNGKTWTDSGAPTNADGYNAVIGDGTNIYVQTANTSKSTTGMHPYSYSPESDGTHWSAFNEQTFLDGPGWMAFDPSSKIVYSSNWNAGLWRLVTGK